MQERDVESPMVAAPLERTTSPLLADRYHELMEFRREAFIKYKANDISFVAGPKAAVCLPVISTRSLGVPKKRLGPIGVYDRSPIASFVERDLRDRKSSASVLEIGPGTGELARSLQAQFTGRVEGYFAIERDRNISGPYTRLESVEELPSTVDIVIASEVIEHMSADAFYATVLEPLKSKLTPNSSFIAGTPNPLSPGGIARDFTHVQNYPWYDLYAIFRLVFEDVQIYRTTYLYDLKRLLFLVPRVILCGLIELEWCEGLVCVATRPRVYSEGKDNHASS